MPARPPKPCRKCKVATDNSNGFCDSHQVEAGGWAAAQKGKTTTRRGYGWAHQKSRQRILARDKHLCQPCLVNRIYSPAKIVDHIVNKKAGGSDDDSNKQAICNECHKVKTAQESAAGRRLKKGGAVKSPWLLDA